MKRILGVLALAGVLTLPAVQLAPTPARADNCPNKNSKGCHSAITITAYSGTFRVPVVQTKLVLKGHASKATHGTQIFAQRVVAPHTPTHGTAFRVFAVGHLPSLSLIGKAYLYQYKTSNNHWSMVRTVKQSGIYAAVAK